MVGSTVVSTSNEDLLRQYHSLPDGEERQEGRDELILSSIGLVESIARKHSEHGALEGFSSEDLRQEGSIGSIRAVDRFDPNRGIKFSTYAYDRIDGSIKDTLRRVSGMPRSLYDSLVKYQSTVEDLEQEYQRKPTPNEIAVRLGVPVENIEEIQYALRFKGPSSIEEYAHDDSEETVAENLTEESNVLYQEGAPEELLYYIKEGMKRLKPKYRNVLDLHFFQGLEQTEIAKIMRCGPTYVNRLIHEGVDVLKFHVERMIYQENQRLYESWK